MGSRLKSLDKRRADAVSADLPARIRALYVTSYHRTGSWLAEAFASDSASDVVIEEALGAAEGATRLRDEAFDVVLVSHDPEQLDALSLIEGFRAGGTEEPILVLGEHDDDEMAALCYEVGADAYVPVNSTTTRTLIWLVARAMQRHRLTRENSRWAEAERQRRRQEQTESHRVLEEHRSLVDKTARADRGGANASRDPRREVDPPAGESQPAGSPEALPLPPKLVAHYRELLRTFVIMGSGNLTNEMQILAEVLAAVGVSARQTLELHLRVLEELVSGLGNRSTRHVMIRAELLLLDLMVNLADGYRVRYRATRSRERQLVLPGFEVTAPSLIRHE